MTIIKVKAILLTICCFFPFFVWSQSANYEPNELLVKWKTHISTTQRTNVKAELKTTTVRALGNSGIELWKVTENKELTTLELANKYSKHPAFDFIEPNYIYTITQFVPNDEQFGDLWGMNNTGQNNGKFDADIDATEAWAIQNKSPTIKVAIIDTGIDWKHPDLVDNIWQNLGEDADGDGKVLEWDGEEWIFDPGDLNNQDDDGNGLEDDLIGWDFRNDDNDPFDGNAHGTHVAGTVGAKGDNDIGVAGVTWDVQLAALKFLSNRGSGRTSDAIEAINYAANMGMQISNNSWGGNSSSEALYITIQDAASKNHLVIAAAGNSGNNSDDSPNYPAAYDLPNIIAVASTDRQDALSYFSNYGSISVDIGAPGSDILSCFPNNSYNMISGTSMAAPHVSGACALLWESNINRSYMDIKNTLLETADAIPALGGQTVSGKRLNLCKLIGGCNAEVSCSVRDSLALVALYNATNGADWTTTWNLQEPMSTWNGITLNGRRCVTEIDLTNNQLLGSIPADIGNISELEILNLNTNELSGDLPIAIGNLSKLTSLFLGENQFSGSIPAILDNLSNLQILFLNDNQFSGSVPIALFEDLDNLLGLDLSNNQLSGDLPPRLADLPNLQQLLFNNNQFSGCFPQTYKDRLCSIGLSDFSENSGLPNNGDFTAFCADGTGGCTDGEDLVWPGDLNNDGKADLIDFLFGSRARARTGPSRVDQGTDWSPKLSPDWSTELIGVNGKHQDANGDGTIDFQDISVLIDNLGNVHSTSNSLSTFFADGTILYLKSLTPNSNGELLYQLKARQGGMGISLHGLACIIDFNKFKASSVAFDITNSCLEPDDFLIDFDPENQKLALALSRVDGVDKYCSNSVEDDHYLGTLKITTESQITNDTLLLEIEEGRKMSADGSLNLAVGSSLYDPYSPSEPSNSTMKITVSTTPEDCTNLGTASLTIEGGIGPYNVEWSTGDQTHTIIDLFRGEYSVTVTDSGNNPTPITKIIKVEIDKQFIPVFDQTGRPIECTDFNDTSCPNTLRLSNNTLITRTYHAATTLSSRGTVAVGSEVNFKAGETITLQPGFTVVQGGAFYAIIEECTATNTVGRHRPISGYEKPVVVLSNQPIQQDSLSITIQPNPLWQQANIVYNLPNTSKIQMVLTDMQGKPIRQLLDNIVQKAGQHQLNFKADNLSRGMYLLTLQTPDYMETRKMILLE